MVNIQFDGLSIESAPPIFTPEFVSPALTAEAMTYVYYSNLEEFRTEEDALGIFGPNLSTSYLQLLHQIQWSIYSLLVYLLNLQISPALNRPLLCGRFQLLVLVLRDVPHCLFLLCPHPRWPCALVC